MESRFEVRVSDDGLEARLDVAPGPASDREALLAAISEAGVCKGLLEDALDELAEQLREPDFETRDRVVAKGVPPRPGTDGRLEVALSKDIPVAHLEPQAATAKGEAPGFFASVIPRQQIGTYVAPLPGQPGWSVSGEDLPCPEAVDPLERLGEGLECTAMGQVCANAVGVVIRRPGEALEVRPLASEERLVLSIGEDAMCATARVFPGEPGDAATLGVALAGAGIVHGACPEAAALLEESLGDPLFARDELVVARGSRAERGADGCFVPRFSAEAPAGKLAAGKIRPDGRFDYRDRSLLMPAREGEILGVYHGAEAGTAGQTLLGEEIPAAAGVERMPALGPGAELASDSATIHATRTGVILYQEGKLLDVVDASEHRGDVDLKSGDLRVGGALLVTGSVARNARVSATGPVVIKGVVDGGSVESEGSVSIVGGAIGVGDSRIQALGDVSCRHALGARIESGETLVIQKTSINSSLRGRIVRGESDALTVLGGEVRAEERIAIRDAGSRLGSRTLLAVGRPKGALRLLDVARIEVSGTAHAGVVVQIGRHVMTLEDPVSGAVFRYDEGVVPPIVWEPLAE